MPSLGYGTDDGGGDDIIIPPNPPALNKIDHFGYIIGYPEDYITGEECHYQPRMPVKPQGNITRAEVATIFFRLLDDATRAQYMTRENNFPDVEEGMWFNTAVSTMAAMGIVNGYPDGNFHPDAYITRAEFAAIAARFDSKGNTTGASFSDIYGHWAQKEINLAYNNGWILGYEDGSFKPEGYIKRGEAAKIIDMVMKANDEKIFRNFYGVGAVFIAVCLWCSNYCNARTKQLWYFNVY
jgi:hypothetical protein